MTIILSTPEKRNESGFWMAKSKSDLNPIEISWQDLNIPLAPPGGMADTTHCLQWTSMVKNTTCLFPNQLARAINGHKRKGPPNP